MLFFSLTALFFFYFWKFIILHSICSRPDGGIIINSSRATNQDEKTDFLWPRGERQSGSSKWAAAFLLLCLTRRVSEICLQIKCVRKICGTHAHTHTWKRGCGSAAATWFLGMRANTKKSRSEVNVDFLKFATKLKTEWVSACHMPHAACSMLMQKVLTRA